MLDSLERWLNRKKKIKEDPTEVLSIQIVCLEDEVEMLREHLENLELKELAARTIIRKQKAQI